MNTTTDTAAQIADLQKLIRELEHYVLTAPEGSERRAFFQRHLDNACELLARAGVDC